MMFKLFIIFIVNEIKNKEALLAAPFKNLL